MKSSRIYINSIIVLIKQMSKLKKGDMRSKYNLNVLQVPDHLITIFIVVWEEKYILIWGIDNIHICNR